MVNWDPVVSDAMAWREPMTQMQARAREKRMCWSVGRVKKRGVSSASSEGLQFEPKYSRFYAH